MRPIYVQSETATADTTRIVVAAETYAEAVILNGFLAEGFAVLARRAELPGGLTNDEVTARRHAFDATPTFTGQEEALPQYELSDAKIAYAGAGSYVRKAASRLARRSRLDNLAAREAQMRRQRVSKQLAEIIKAASTPLPDAEDGNATTS